MAGRAARLSKRISGAWLNMRDGLNSSPLVGTRTTARIVACLLGMRTIRLGMRTGTNAGGELMASCFVTQPEICIKRKHGIQNGAKGCTIKLDT